MPTKDDAARHEGRSAKFLLNQIKLAHEKIRILETHLIVADAERHKAEAQVTQLLESRTVMIEAFKDGRTQQVQQAIKSTHQMLANIYESIPENDLFNEDEN